jgi:hypothetical protein
VKNIKQHIRNFFLLLAGIILAVHVVVPHHHHNEQICLGGSHCQSEIFPHSHNSKFPVHDHDGNKTNTCVLQQTFTLPVNQGKYDAGCDLNCVDNHSHDFIFIILFSQAERPITVIANVTAPPDIVSVWDDFIPISSGLRAPPTV